jgi:NAD(P)-dependent dehydrogenase (short-subunit alcohol dehydrogenase family)
VNAYAGKTALVTGAASGIGRATAQRLARDWPELILVDKDSAGLSAAAAAIADCGGQVTTETIDLSEPAGLAAAAADLARRHQIDLLVNNAGIGYAATTIETTMEQWDQTLAVDLTAVFVLCQAVLPGMITRGHGTIVNVASAGGLVGLRQRVAYCAAKAGVIGLTRAIAADHAMQGIRVNAIAPGTVASEWIGKILATDPDPESARKRMEMRQLDGRMGTPAEVAEGIAFLASPEARFVNGSVFVMDAGLTAV